MSISDEHRLIAGAMSGTSADGVDVALVRVGSLSRCLEASGAHDAPERAAVKLVAYHHVPYDPQLRQKLFALRGAEQVSAAPTFLRELAELGQKISLIYAQAVNETLALAKLSNADLTAVAAHGQTLYHAPPLTIQWLDPSLIAAEVGCAVISDFRRADCAAGGQGAPLVPFADYVLFRSRDEGRVLLNLGGIANLTFIPAGASREQILAFDTGPANCISDDLMRRLDPTGDGVDIDGGLAARGVARIDVVDRVLAGEYFDRRPPKSTDGPAMLAPFHRETSDSADRNELPNLLATACLITARSVAREIAKLPRSRDRKLRLFASGGGTLNRTLMRMLHDELRVAGVDVPVESSDALGIPSAAKEAVAFALLGAATLDDQPGNIPAATGAGRAVVLGSITPKP